MNIEKNVVYIQFFFNTQYNQEIHYSRINKTDLFNNINYLNKIKINNII